MQNLTSTLAICDDKHECNNGFMAHSRLLRGKRFASEICKGYGCAATQYQIVAVVDDQLVYVGMVCSFEQGITNPRPVTVTIYKSNSIYPGSS